MNFIFVCRAPFLRNNQILKFEILNFSKNPFFTDFLIEELYHKINIVQLLSLYQKKYTNVVTFFISNKNSFNKIMYALFDMNLNE